MKSVDLHLHSTRSDGADEPSVVVARAAAMMGISRQRAYRLMEGQTVDLQALRKPGDPET